MPKLPLSPVAVFNLVRELRAGDERKPLVVGGARELVGALRRELTRDGDPGAVREASLGALEDAAALVYVLAGDVTDEDERALRAADRAGVPIVALGPTPHTAVPHVLATDVIPLAPGHGFPLEELGRRLGAKLDEGATSLAARLPVLRRGVSEALIAKVSRQNAILGAAIFIPGADFPALTVNQLRMVLRLAQAHGQQLDVQRVPEILGVIGSGLGLRALARQAASALPLPRVALRGSVAYTGTRAVGEAALRYFELLGELGGRGPEPGAPGADRA